jgi:hypothetical protein
VPVEIPLAGTVKNTIEALLPLITAKRTHRTWTG